METNSIKLPASPYELGHCAGCRLPPYKKDVLPENPYTPGTQNAEDWDEGFGEGTEDYIAYQWLDLDDH